MPKAPQELGAFVGLKKVVSSAPFPQEFWGARICLLMSCYDGAEEAGKKALAPLLDKLPPPALNWIGTMPYPAVQSMFDGLYPKGMQWYWRAKAVTQWTKAYWEAVHPFDLDGAYPNFMMDDEGDARLATYGENYPRLAAVKKKYDPMNLFRVNQNIRPAS